MVLLQKIPLHSGWLFKRKDDVAGTWTQITRVPSVNHIDLIEKKLIPDPFISTGELDVEWVGEKAWTYRTEFASPDHQPGASVYIILKGLDTFAKISFNDVSILQSDNMFLEYRIDITRLIRSGAPNTLCIDFESALLRARQLQKEHPEHRFIASNGEANRVAVRKAQYHWGWDWGPVLMTAGPWRPISLEVSVAYIEQVKVDYQFFNDLTNVTGNIHVQAHGNCNRVEASLYLGGTSVLFLSRALDIDGRASLPFAIDNIKLWYPVGYGSQNLYNLRVDILHQDVVLDSYEQRTGFRQVELIQAHDSHGQSFYFRCNNIDIFCGGACWIPADSLLPRVSSKKYRRSLELMIEGNQNMIRVWGGGIYEEDVFYNTCDELGILVWQDFMFACGNYPTWPNFRESVTQEAQQNLRRLRHHPSIIIWAGNNEDYQIREDNNLDYNYEDMNVDRWLSSSFPARYYYEHLLPKIVAEESSSVIYWPGSPFSRSNISSDLKTGDVHQWNVWHGSQEKYQRYDQIGGRFNSEFGLAAFPHIDTIKSFVIENAEMFPQSRTMDFHNKADGHDRRIATYLIENFRISRDLETYAYLTQLAQSEAMAYAYRGWRREWGEQRKCGGALVWQLNDCWPGISWSIVDYHLRRKAAYYSIARALRPIAIGVQREHHDWSVSHARPAKSSAYKLWIASSQLDVLEVDVELRFVSIASGKDVRPTVTKTACPVQPNGTTVILNGTLDAAGMEPHVLAARVFHKKECISRDVDWPQPLKYLDFSDRGVKVRVAKGKYTITSARPTKGLLLEERDGTALSDNCIDVMPGDVQLIDVNGDVIENPKVKYLGFNEAVNMSKLSNSETMAERAV